MCNVFIVNNIKQNFFQMQALVNTIGKIVLNFLKTVVIESFKVKIIILIKWIVT